MLVDRSSGATASLRDIKITVQLRRRRTMDKAFDRFALRDVTRCFGNRPWLGREQEECDQTVRTLQRGASNVWFGSHRSVISIPPWSDSRLPAPRPALGHLPRASGHGACSGDRAVGLTAGTNFHHPISSMPFRSGSVDRRGIKAQPLRKRSGDDEYRALERRPRRRAGQRVRGA